MDGYVINFVQRVASNEALALGQCFACGGPPTTGNGEHVIPSWLQRRFNLYNKRLTLLNGTFIPYRGLTIPCCTNCNNGFLRDIENSILSLIDCHNDLENSQKLALARWICKIFIGILIKEANLPRDRRYLNNGNIVPFDLIDEFTHAQLILQISRKTTNFHCLHGPFPFTIYTYKIFKDNDFGDFDFSTHLFGQSVAIRIGNLAAIFVNDGGLQLAAGQKGPLELDGRELHPLQFSEVAARVHYKASLRDANHLYVSSETPDELTIRQESVRPFTNIIVDRDAQRIFRPWDDAECAEFIERYRPINWGAVHDSLTGTFSTTLMDRNQQLPHPITFVRKTKN